jgi:hypothetical protein
MTMDDRFLHERREAPRPAFAAGLRERLRETEDAAGARQAPWRPLAAAAAGVAVVALAFTLPAVRAVAQDALDLFRVRSFAPVEFDESRLDQLRQLQDRAGSDPTLMVFDDQEVLKEPGPPVDYPSAGLAASAAGLPGLREPGSLPAGFHFEKAVVAGDGAARLTIHADRLRNVLDALELRDVRVPDGFDGRSITVHKPSIVQQRWTDGKRTLLVLEAMSPEVTLPPGAELRQLGELGLRVLGLDAAEARRMADGIDWRSTLLVPVPTNAGSFRRVTVAGQPALFIRTNARTRPDGTRERSGAMVMWSDGARVHAVQGDLDGAELLDVAQSLH